MNREILRLAIPNIISNISVPLLSTVDTALMGHLSALHLGAVGIGGMMFNFLYWNFGFLRMGTTGMTAQEYGGSGAQGISEVLGRSVVLAVVIAVVLVIAAPWYYSGLTWMLDVRAEHDLLVQEYFRYRIWAAPATLMLYALMGWFFGMQDAISPLIITVSLNVVNILCSYLLVQYAGWGISGVAIGTVIAQYTGVLVAIGIIMRRYDEYIRTLSGHMMALGVEWYRFFRVQRDLFIRTVGLTLAFVIFYRVSSSAGAVVLAAHVVLQQYVHWLSYAIDGYAYAAESIVGKYLGQRDLDKVKKVVLLVLLWGFLLSVMYTAALWAFRVPIISIFTDAEDVIVYINDTYHLVLWTPILAFACYIWDGIYIGVLKTRLMRDTMLISLVIYYWLVYHLWSDMEFGLWLAFLVFLACRGVFLALFWYYTVWPKLRIEKSV